MFLLLRIILLVRILCILCILCMLCILFILFILFILCVLLLLLPLVLLRYAFHYYHYWYYILCHHQIYCYSYVTTIVSQYRFSHVPFISHYYYLSTPVHLAVFYSLCHCSLSTICSPFLSLRYVCLYVCVYTSRPCRFVMSSIHICVCMCALLCLSGRRDRPDQGCAPWSH